jgi:cobalt-zinc-cadmium efflux system outer membrane protein
VILPLRTRIVEQTQLQFNAMQVSPFQLLTAKQQQVEAGRQYVEALRDYWLARTQLEQVLAGRMPQVSADEFTASGARAAGASQTGGH